MRTARWVHLADSRRSVAFWSGCLAVTLGVLLHIPMFLMGEPPDYVLAGMPMDAPMTAGMILIVLGVALTAYGLLPVQDAVARPMYRFSVPDDGVLRRPHWVVASVLSVALIVDVMKPATLGFALPGMRREYGLAAPIAAWLPLVALTGTAVGSYLWGVLADRYGRRASILLSSVMFIGTSVCGAMPAFWWNVFMCFMMGLAAGGMLPVAFALLAEIMPARHRGWCLVLVGGIGAVGGYFATSMLSALLQPHFGWRILWFLNLPTGLLLIGLSPLLPESARFLQLVGRFEEARAELARFGAQVRAIVPLAAPDRDGAALPRMGLLFALTFCALAWGLVNFGVLIWLPGVLVEEGRSVAAVSSIIAQSALYSAPIVVVSTWLYGAWSTKGSLMLMILLTLLGLVALPLREVGVGSLSNPVIPVALLVIGSCGLISMLLPYAAESFAISIRGRATGWVAGCSKAGGLVAQGLSVAGAIPAFGTVALIVAVPALFSVLLIAVFGRETLGADLGELEREAPSDQSVVNARQSWSTSSGSVK